MRWLPTCLALAGCASAGPQNTIVGGVADAGTGDSRGAAADAAEGEVTLVETTSNSLALGRSFACVLSPFTLENSYYRVFTPADHGVSGTLHVTHVDFAIDTAKAATGGSQPGKINLGTYTGVPGAATLDLSLVTPLSSTDITIPDGPDGPDRSGTQMTVPITADVAADAHLLVELFIPKGVDSNTATMGNVFLIGMSGDPERQPGYTRGPGCGTSTPVTMQSLAGTDDAFVILMTVTGTASTTPN
jgi:hypothetical protein